MTKGQFLEALRTRGNDVHFEGSRLSGPGPTVSEALADSLDATLPNNETVRFGVETSSFGADWTGQLTWLLALGRQLLELTAEIEKDPGTGEARALKIRQRIIPVVGEESGTKIELKYKGRMQLVLEEARVILRDGSHVAGDRTSPKGLCGFFCAILSAARTGEIDPVE